jgi:hypothetical protein
MIIIKLITIIAIFASLFFQFYFYRKIISVCDELYLDPPKWEHWFFIEYVWGKSRKPGKERLKPFVSAFCLSFAVFLICIPLIIYIF